MFNEYDLRANLEGKINFLKKDVESDRTILKPDFSESEYTSQKIRQNKIDPLVLHTDRIIVSQIETNIPGNSFPSGYIVEPYQTYTKPVIIFHLPFEGNSNLLRCLPSTRLMWTDEITVEGDNIIFELINFNNDVTGLQQSKDQFLKNLEQQILYINKEVDTYNASLENVVKESITKGKEKIKIQDDILKKLGNPA
jgi:hypothetical protein